MVDIVVAKYKEDISWIKKFKKSKIFIYDKSGEDNGYINLPNIGREAHTYLTHIIENYDNLSDYVCFLQGNPFDGYKGNLLYDYDFLESFSKDLDFYPLNLLDKCDLDGGPLHPNLEIENIIFRKYFKKTPEFLIFSVGAQFIVRKDAILNREKEFYIELLNEFNRTDIDNENTGGGSNTKGNKMPWICERVWTYIFNRNYVTIYDKKMKKMNIYINIAMIGSVNQVLWDLLLRIKQSGLYDSCDKIFLVFNGDRNLLSFKLVSEKYVIIDSNSDVSKCEFPTLDLIWNDCKNSDEEFYVLYLHTKGVSKPGFQNVVDWVNYLSYFNINKWNDRISDLELNDCSGVNFFGNPNDINEHPSTWGYGKAPQHYSGNFWWSKSSHIKKLPNPINWLPDQNYFRWRVMAEMWLCQLNDGKYYNAFSSDVDHYMTPYPKNLYESIS